MKSSREHQLLEENERNVFRARLLAQMIKEDRDLWVGRYKPSDPDIVSIYRGTMLSVAKNFLADRDFSRSVLRTSDGSTDSFIAKAVLPSQLFLEVCLENSGKEMKKYLTKSPFEHMLWDALYNIKVGKGYEKLDALLINYMYLKFFSKEEILNGWMHHESLKKIEDSFEKFYNTSKQTNASKCPDFFTMLDYVNLNLRNRAMGMIGESARLFRAMQSYVSMAVEYSPSHFLTMLGDVDKIMNCLSLKNYEKYYDASKLSDEHLRYVNEHIDDLRKTILETVSCRHYADKIFKKPEDFCKIFYFLSDKNLSENGFNEPANHRWDSWEISKRLFRESMRDYILSDKKLMREIAVSPYRAALYEFLPGIKQACSESTAYMHAALGLLTAKQSGDQPYINQLPKDIIKMIAGKVEDAVKEDGQAKNQKNKKQP